MYINALTKVTENDSKYTKVSVQNIIAKVSVCGRILHTGPGCQH